MFFELSRAGDVEGGMAPDGIVEPVDVAANGPVRLLAGVEDSPPDDLGFQGLKERLHHGVVIAIPLAGHRDQDAVLPEFGLIIDRTILESYILYSLGMTRYNRPRKRELGHEQDHHLGFPAFRDVPRSGDGSGLPGTPALA